MGKKLGTEFVRISDEVVRVTMDAVRDSDQKFPPMSIPADDGGDADVNFVHSMGGSKGMKQHSKEE